MADITLLTQRKQGADKNAYCRNGPDRADGFFANEAVGAANRVAGRLRSPGSTIHTGAGFT